jgi:hypothetical protein
MADEARHVAFGIVSLSEYYRNLSSAELKDRQEFLLENTVRNRQRSTTPEVWERLGVRLEDLIPHMAEAGSRIDLRPFQAFQRAFFSELVPNVAKLGLLDANDGYLREKWGEVGLLAYEHADDTATDFEADDVVAAERAAEMNDDQRHGQAHPASIRT